MVQGEIDGTIQAKSYLSGNPTIRLALPSELSIGAGPVFGSAGDHGVYLDDCNFHEQVKTVPIQ